MTKIASITVTSKRHKIIGEALDSVKDQVDAFIFVDLGIGPKTEQAILEHTSTKPCHHIECPKGLTTADWRNLGLSFAQELGFDWAIQLDTDERMIFGDVDLRKELEEVNGVDTLAALHENGSYSKDRFFHLPTTHKFHGHVHEYWDGEKVGLLAGVLFDEIPKTEEQIDKNIPKQLRKLRGQMRRDKLNHRWPFYLAVFHRALGNHRVAIGYLTKCLKLKATPEAKAWDCYIASRCAQEVGDSASIMEWVLKGLQHHPGFAELSFMGGVSCLNQARPQEALCWANMAIANGLVAGSSFAGSRLGFREPYMLAEGPFQMQADCMKAMGYPEDKIQESLSVVEEIKARRKNEA